MRKYNIQNYIRYKKDVEQALKRVKKPEDGVYTFLTNDEKCFSDFITLSLGQIFLGLTKDKFSKPKHPIDLRDIPTFSDNWGLFNIN